MQRERCIGLFTELSKNNLRNIHNLPHLSAIMNSEETSGGIG